MRKETYKIKCPKHIVFGDPLYFEEYKGAQLKKLVVDYEVPAKFDTARLVLEEKPFEEYPDMMHRTMTIFLAPHDHINVYLSNHKYKVQQEAAKVIGVDTARYLFEVDGCYDEIRTMADGVWGITHEFYRMNGNRRISDAVIIVVDMPEDKDFQEMRELARYFFEDMLSIVRAFKPRVFDAVISDPPYASGGSKPSEKNRTTVQKYSGMRAEKALPDFDGDNRDQRSWTRWMAEWLSDVRKACKPGAPICLFIDWRQYPCMTDALQWAGWIWRGVAVWDMTTKPDEVQEAEKIDALSSPYNRT